MGYLALLSILIGHAQLLPTTLSFALVISAYLGLRWHVPLEEAYLLRTYGEAYRDYARRVGRFLPGSGRLR